MGMVMFTIGEVADLLNITPKTIRHYHKIGLVDEPDRDANNYRYYTIEQIEQIQSVLRLKTFGLSLKQIKVILKAGQPEALIRSILKNQEHKVQSELLHLQQQLDNIQDYLETDINAPTAISSVSASMSTESILKDSIRPISNGLSDIIITVEGDVFSKLDDFPQDEDYQAFVHQIGKQLATQLIEQESLFIFWMERYLSLGTMAGDDLQGKSWLSDLQTHTARKLIASSLQLPAVNNVSDEYQKHIQKLFLALLLEDSSSLQKQFITLLAE